SLLFIAAMFVHAQTGLDEPAVLHVNTDTPEADLIPPENLPDSSKVTAGLIRDKDKRLISPQPGVDVNPQPDGSLKIKFSRVFFWGDAFLPLTFTPGPPTSNQAASKSLSVTYKLERGVGISSSDIDVPRNQPGIVWLHNPDVIGVQARWRVVTASEILCGLDPKGQLREDCNDTSKLPAIRIPATRSIPLRVDIPAWWRDPLHVVTGVDDRQGQLELLFGRGDLVQQSDSDIRFRIHSNALDAATAWIPGGVYSTIADIIPRIRVLFWITIGAVLLMLAQVIVPNFRRSLQMEARIDGFRERLRAINSAVGNRLYTRCQNEIARVTEALGVREPDSKAPRTVSLRGRNIRIPDLSQSLSVFNRDRVVLCGNSQEILRLEALLPRIESRLALTERFSDLLTGFLTGDALTYAPTSVFLREERLTNLREILSRQLLTDAEEANARIILRELEAGCDSSDDFVSGLNARLDALRRQLSSAVFMTRAARYIALINGAADVLAETTSSAPAGGWSDEELLFRDLVAVKLRIIVFAVEIENLLAKDPQLDLWIQEKLQSKDPIVLAKISAALKHLSEGISVEDIRVALQSGLWDTLWEPPSVRNQDVLQFAFLFRDKAINSSSAKDKFRCYWKIVDSETGDESWEEGWSMQYIPSQRHFTVTPAIYDSAGNEVSIGTSDSSGKGKAEIRVTSTANASGRAIRGLIDALITALVPVVTVAVTQVQNGGLLSTNKLILLGFTSQAIRAAILPESVRPEQASMAAADARGATTTAPSSPPPDATRGAAQAARAAAA
ncbi:MAG TPA: hypothetical protein VHA14_09260, partial [Bryobacteraceae bacterium]|nr:hypothetical protein [Bryobacteraceae bacterium]